MIHKRLIVCLASVLSCIFLTTEPSYSQSTVESLRSSYQEKKFVDFLKVLNRLVAEVKRLEKTPIDDARQRVLIKKSHELGEALTSVLEQSQQRLDKIDFKYLSHDRKPELFQPLEDEKNVVAQIANAFTQTRASSDRILMVSYRYLSALDSKLKSKRIDGPRRRVFSSIFEDVKQSMNAAWASSQNDVEVAIQTLGESFFSKNLHGANEVMMSCLEKIFSQSPIFYTTRILRLLIENSRRVASEEAALKLFLKAFMALGSHPQYFELIAWGNKPLNEKQRIALNLINELYAQEEISLSEDDASRTTRVVLTHLARHFGSLAKPLASPEDFIAAAKYRRASRRDCELAFK